MNAQQWLAQLIGFNTISSNSNMELIKTIAEWFKLHHIQPHLIPSPKESKANLFATIPAKNGQTQGGLLLSGHTDVVPVAGQIWTTDPFVATQHDGKIYGRGASDMKGFLAVLLALLPEFTTLKLSKPLHFAFTYDEEVGCIGVDFYSNICRNWVYNLKRVSSANRRACTLLSVKNQDGFFIVKFRVIPFIHHSPIKGVMLFIMQAT